MTGILKWLAQEMQAGNMAPREECELRLESDEEAVRIITVHKSKGLEFDVVFCPYVGSNAITRPTFHDPEENYRLTLDLLGSEEYKPIREKEALAEALRLFYVAVTRARHRCTMVWQAKAKREKSAPAFLLGNGLQPAIESADIAIAETPKPNDNDFCPERGARPHLEARRFTGAIDRTWGIASFTRLVSGRETCSMKVCCSIRRRKQSLTHWKVSTLSRAGCTPAPACTKFSKRSTLRISETPMRSCSAGSSPAGSTASTPR
jgi:exodeoxyribonuclease V beta subunit